MKKKIVKHYLITPAVLLIVMPWIWVALGESWIDSFKSMLMVTIGYVIAYTGRDIEVLDGETEPVLGEFFKKRGNASTKASE